MTRKKTQHGRVSESQKFPKSQEHIDLERRVAMLRADLDNPSVRHNAGLDFEDGLHIWESIKKKLEKAEHELAQHEAEHRRACRRARRLLTRTSAKKTT